MQDDQEGATVEPPVPKKAGRHRSVRRRRFRITAELYGNVSRTLYVMFKVHDGLTKHETPTREFLIGVVVKVGKALWRWLNS